VFARKTVIFVALGSLAGMVFASIAASVAMHFSYNQTLSEILPVGVFLFSGITLGFCWLSTFASLFAILLLKATGGRELIQKAGRPIMLFLWKEIRVEHNL
jgi:hypothetical protein